MLWLTKTIPTIFKAVDFNIESRKVLEKSKDSSLHDEVEAITPFSLA